MIERVGFRASGLRAGSARGRRATAQRTEANDRCRSTKGVHGTVLVRIRALSHSDEKPRRRNTTRLVLNDDGHAAARHRLDQADPPPGAHGRQAELAAPHVVQNRHLSRRGKVSFGVKT